MPPDGERTRIERAVFEEILDLHPDHLTVPELVLKVAADGNPSEGDAIKHAVRDLKGSGLLRDVGGVVVPTHAALRAAALLVWP